MQTQAQNTFQKNYGQGGDGEQIINTVYGNYEVGQLNGDVYVSQFDNWGNIIWDYTYGGSNTEEGNSIVITHDGKFLYIGATTYSFCVNGIDAAYVLKVDATNGNLIWSKSIYGDGTNMNSSEGHSIELTSDGGCIVAGVSSAFTASNGIFVVKFDPNGNINAFSFYYGLGPQISADIKQTADGGYIICSSGAVNTNTEGDLLLLKLNSNFTQEWAKLYGGKTIDYGFSVKETVDHGFIATGYASSFSPGQSIYAVYVVRTNSMGDTLWTKTIGTADKTSGARSIDLVADDFVLTGFNDSSCFLTKINSNGAIVWDRNIEFINTNIGLRSVAPAKDGGYFLTGQYNGTIYIAKADSTGSVGCNETDAGMTSVSVPTIVTNVVLSQVTMTPKFSTPATITSKATPIVVICSSNSVPTSSNVEIVGTPHVGQTLTANSTYYDVDGDLQDTVKYLWFVNNTVVDTGDTYVVKSSDLNKYIRLEATQIAQTGELVGLPKSSIAVRIISDSDGILELYTENISVYPNPASDYLMVSSAEGKNLQIFNSIGQIIFQKKIENQKETINLVNLPNGTYFYSLGNGNKKLIILK